MRTGSLGVLLLLILAAATAVTLPPVRGDTSPPTIHDRWWEPRYPIAPEQVHVYADVSDPDGVKMVDAIWCYVPAFLCFYPELVDNGTGGDAISGDGIYTAIVDTNDQVIGASYLLHVVDMLDNSYSTPKIYALFVDSVNVTLDESFFAAEPGQDVTVNGTAFYESNASAPAEGVTVTVSVEGNTAQATVDAAGRFSASLTAPVSDGTYAITATATDRTLTGTADATLAASTVPRADLTVTNVQLPSEMVVGQPTTVTFDVRNLGTADAVDVRVVVQVQEGSTWRTVYDQRVAVAKGGGTVTLAAQWTVREGSQSIRIQVDPDGEVDELNEVNGVQALPVTVRPPDFPILWVGAGVGIGAAVAVSGGLILLRRRRVRTVPTPIDEGKAL